MRFLQIINEKKFTLITMLLSSYLIFNLLEGDRGLLSYYENHKLINKLNQDKRLLEIKLTQVEKKIDLLTDKINLDYLEILYRNKFMVGKKSERVFLK